MASVNSKTDWVIEAKTIRSKRVIYQIANPTIHGLWLQGFNIGNSLPLIIYKKI